MNHILLSYIASVLFMVSTDAQDGCLVGRVCPSITDKVTCLSSRDNRAGHLNQPCAWCDGPSCTTNNDNKCEPVGWLFNRDNLVEPDEFTIASIGLTPRVCPLIVDATTCLSSKDDRTGFLDQPCVWCAGGACTEGIGNRCEPVGWLFEHQNQLNPQKYKVAVACTPLTGDCLVRRACWDIQDLSTCLSSKDNRDFHLDEPCVWCDAGPCHESNDNRCEPVEWLFGNNKQLNPGEYEIASSGLIPRVCPLINDRSICLSSRDNRANHLDEPCVWCASGACTTNNDNKCEPASWLFEQTNQLNSDDYEVAVSGYSGIIHTNGVTCSDINECENMPCGNNGECQNLEGSYQCKCNNGYQFDGRTCIDINECQGTNECGDYPTRCINTDGGYYCEENCVVHCEGNCQEIMQ